MLAGTATTICHLQTQKFGESIIHQAIWRKFLGTIMAQESPQLAAVAYLEASATICKIAIGIPYLKKCSYWIGLSIFFSVCLITWLVGIVLIFRWSCGWNSPGDTEGGSSGSPLFSDSNKRIFGQLWGGKKSSPFKNFEMPKNRVDKDDFGFIFTQKRTFSRHSTG